MTEVELYCNLLLCRKKLGEQAFVTSCFHIFCDNHDQDLFKDKECPACGTKFHHEYDFIQIDLNPSEQYKSIVLTGLNPELIMEIASRAMSFFIYQMNYVNEGTMKHMKQQNEEMKNHYTAMKSKFLADLKKYQLTINSLRDELEEKSKAIEKQRLQIANWNKTNRQLQFQIEAYKRELSKKKANEKQSSFSPAHSFKNMSHSEQGSHRGFEFLEKPYNTNEQKPTFGKSAPFSPFR